MKYNILLEPSLKKNWVHYDVKIFEGEENRFLGYQYSRHHDSGFVDYPAFRVNYENEIEEAINNNNVNLELLKKNRLWYNLYLSEKVENFWENINSIKIKNPIYYCLKSKLIWQDNKEEEKTSDKFIQIKILNKYKHKEEDIVVVECQRDRLSDYMEMGEFYEIKRKHIKEYNEAGNDLMDEKINNRQFKDRYMGILIRIMKDVEI
jgi:hypothetical protein